MVKVKVELIKIRVQTWIQSRVDSRSGSESRLDPDTDLDSSSNLDLDALHFLCNSRASCLVICWILDIAEDA